MPDLKKWKLQGLWVLACALTIQGCASSGRAGGAGDQVITATLADVGNTLQGTTTEPVVIHIEQFSSPQEVQQLANLLAEKGPSAVQDATWRLEKGWIRVGGSLGYPLAVITRRPTSEGQRITILLDRPVTYREQWQNLRSADYPFGYIELNLDRNGRGDGQFIPAGQIRLSSTGALEVVQYGFQPVRLLNVQVQRG
ncbi:MAG TPA: hypothetical protein VEL74_12260 [Thermoanaerobaculia bacterium]|nr:hypothetical protein [Thermoanaerobaculia bacterium]